MDQRSFDRFARILGGAASRRAGIRAAIAGLLGLTALEDAAARGKNHGTAGDNGKPGRKDRGKGDGRGHDRRPRPEGPCGNGSRKDNACTKDKQCCTGLCNKKAGKKNLDGEGRCRCVRKNGKCKEDRNCCSRKGQQLSCISGVCGAGGSGIPTSEPCTEGGTPCEDPNAACTTYDEGSGGPAGTYCLLPILEKTCAKAADCGCNSCYDGTCLTCGCGGCPEPSACAAPKVCASGCAHATVQAAVNAAASGDTITIGPGTYSEDVTISGKNLILLGCPRNGEVILINATQGNRTIDVTDESDLTLNDVTIKGNNDVASTISGGGVATAGGDVCIGMRSRFAGCAKFGDNGGGIDVEPNTNEDQKLHVTDAVVFDGNTTDTYGGGIYVHDSTAVTLDGRVKLINNKAKNGGGISIHFKATLTASGNVEITDNQTDSYGGGIFFYGGGITTPTTRGRFGGAVLIARNTSGAGGGISAWYSDQNETFVIEDDVVITGNTADTYGGGVGVSGANLTIAGNTKITQNRTTDVTNTYGGGGVFFDHDSKPITLTIEGNAEISGNTTAAMGGGVKFVGPTFNLGGAAAIRNNTASLNGGGVQADPGGPCTIAISGTASITGNTATDGGGIWDEAGGVTVTGGSAVTGNTPDNCDGNGLTC